MIRPSKELRRWIGEFKNQGLAADALGVSRQFLSNLLNGKCSAGEDFIEKVDMRLGWEFDKSFEITKDESK